MINISVFLKNNAFKPCFTKLYHKKINDLLKKSAFEAISITNIISRIRIFNFHFVDKIKTKKIAMAFEKSRLMIQFYNNYNKEKILISLSTI